jgi:radical SAM superfamily enzyme YgiQ (UPF0313 family)
MLPLPSATGPVLIPPAEPGTTVLLIHSPYPAKPRFDGLPSSLLSASARLIEHLAERGVTVGLMDPGTTSEGFYENLERVLRAGSVRVVCISTSTAAIEETARIVRTIRAECGPSPFVVVGGPHEDACRLKAGEAIEGIDISVAGDGEFVLLDLVRKFLSVKSGARAVTETLSVLGDDPSRLRGHGTVTSRAWGAPFGRPFDFGSTEVESFHTRCQVSRPVRFDVFPGGIAVPLTISRGCSYGRCTFCSEGGPGVKARVAPDFAWIRELSARHPGVPLYFQDSIFPATRGVRQLLLPMLKNLGVDWGCQVYIPTLSRNLLAELAEHRCTYLYTGIESGSNEVLRSIGKTALTRELMVERIGWFAEHGVRAGLSLMFGAMTPNGRLVETKRTVADTVSLARELADLGVPIAGFYPNIQTVLPGTALDYGLAAHGLDLDFYSMPQVPEFAYFEDGAVGYNFLSVGGGTSQERRTLARNIQLAAQGLESPRRNSGPRTSPPKADDAALKAHVLNPTCPSVAVESGLASCPAVRVQPG